MKAVLDTESNLSYGYWRCPECSAEFHGSVTFHKAWCPLDTPDRNDFEQLTYRYTRKEYEDFLEGVGLMPACIQKLLREKEVS